MRKPRKSFFDFHGSEPIMILWKALQNKIFHSYDTWPNRIITRLRILVNDVNGAVENDVAVKDERNIYSSRRLDNVEIPAATSKTAGLMTAWDKEKLTNIEKYIRWTDAAMPYIAGNYNYDDPFCTMTPTEVDITYKVYDLKTREYDRTIYIPGATSTTAGLMSSDFFTKVSMLPELPDRVYWWFGYCGLDWELDRVTYTDSTLTLHYPNIGVAASDPDERATDEGLTWTAVTDMMYTLESANYETAGLLSAEDYSRLQEMWQDADRLINFTFSSGYVYHLNYYDNFSEDKEAYIELDLEDVLQPIWDQISAIWDNIEEIEENIDVIEQNIDEIENNIDNIENDITNIEGDITNIEGDITDINNDITNINNDISSLENSFNTSLNNLEETLNETINSLSEEIYNYINGLDLGVASVTYTASVSSGTLLGTINVDGTTYKIYAPTQSAPSSDDVVPIIEDSVVIEALLTSGVKIASVKIGDQSTFYLYAPESDTSGVTADELETLVTYNASVTSGTLLGYLVVNGEKTAIYAPTAETAEAGSTVTWSGTTTSSDENAYVIGTLTIDGTKYTLYGKYESSDGSSDSSGSTVTWKGTTTSSDDGAYVIGTLTIDGTAYTLYGVDTQSDGSSDSGGSSGPSDWDSDDWDELWSMGIIRYYYTIESYNNDDEYDANDISGGAVATNSGTLYLYGREGIITYSNSYFTTTSEGKITGNDVNSASNPIIFEIDTDWLADWLNDNGYGGSSGDGTTTIEGFTTVEDDEGNSFTYSSTKTITLNSGDGIDVDVNTSSKDVDFSIDEDWLKTFIYNNIDLNEFDFDFGGGGIEAAFTKAVNASATGSQLASLTADSDNYSLIFEAGDGIEISSTLSDLSDSPGIVFAFTVDQDFVKDLIEVEQTLTSGTKIGTVNGVTLYAPSSSGSSTSSGESYWYLDGTNLYASPDSTTAEYAAYATAFYESSDEKLKEDIDYVDVYEMAHRIRCGCSWSGGIPIRQFRFKDDPEHRLRYGFIAQEVEMGEPDLVTTNKDGIKSVDYNSVLSLKLAGVIGLYNQLAQQIQDTQESIGYDYVSVEDQTPLTWSNRKGEHSVYKRLEKIENDITEIKNMLAAMR